MWSRWEQPLAHMRGCVVWCSVGERLHSCTAWVPHLQMEDDGCPCFRGWLWRQPRTVLGCLKSMIHPSFHLHIQKFSLNMLLYSRLYFKHRVMSLKKTGRHPCFIDMYTLSCVKQITSGKLLDLSTESSAWCYVMTWWGMGGLDI